MDQYWGTWKGSCCEVCPFQCPLRSSHRLRFSHDRTVQKQEHPNSSSSQCNSSLHAISYQRNSPLAHLKILPMVKPTFSILTANEINESSLHFLRNQCYRWQYCPWYIEFDQYLDHWLGFHRTFWNYLQTPCWLLLLWLYC